MEQGHEDKFERACGPFIIVEMREGRGECRRVIMNGCGEEKRGSGADLNLD